LKKKPRNIDIVIGYKDRPSSNFKRWALDKLCYIKDSV